MTLDLCTGGQGFFWFNIHLQKYIICSCNARELHTARVWCGMTSKIGVEYYAALRWLVLWFVGAGLLEQVCVQCIYLTYLLPSIVADFVFGHFGQEQQIGQKPSSSTSFTCSSLTELHHCVVLACCRGWP